MDIRSLEELRQADEQTLRFTSLGLATGGKLRPEDAAVFQQEVISHAELVPAVAEGTRNTFERLRSLHAYGVLFYDIFTAVEDLTHLVIEQALRDRFLEFHDGVVPFEDARGTVREVTAATFDVLYDEIHKEGRLRRPQRWRLRLRRTGRTVGRGHPARGRYGRSGVHRAPYDRRPAGVLRGRRRSAPARLLAALTIPPALDAWTGAVGTMDICRNQPSSAARQSRLPIRPPHDRPGSKSPPVISPAR